jgi:hypothetical protein
VLGNCLFVPAPLPISSSTSMTHMSPARILLRVRGARTLAATKAAALRWPHCATTAWPSFFALRPGISKSVRSFGVAWAFKRARRWLLPSVPFRPCPNPLPVGRPSWRARIFGREDGGSASGPACASDTNG